METVWPSGVARSSEGSPFIFPSMPSVAPWKSSGRSTVVVKVPCLRRSSTPAPDGNITVTLLALGENTNTPGTEITSVFQGWLGDVSQASGAAYSDVTVTCLLETCIWLNFVS